MAANPWKAAGEDGLPVMVWKQVWPAVKERSPILWSGGPSGSAQTGPLASSSTGKRPNRERCPRLACRKDRHYPRSCFYFNADLVQRKITASGRSMAFIDDYTAWTSGRAWERPSVASFETDKTAIIHFTRNTDDIDDGPFTIGGVQVEPKDSVKILGIVMDRQLRFKEQLANAATKGLKTAMALRRLRLLAPKVARQLFVATVAPAVD
ncbi:hypothetical protein JX265_013655 [Neoarthrinium moseri]|uniref:Uncharacterized protein n=1 Tax=Neoarthrinium moseri TaxID=1658444 RepID=A0A9P9W888_9PEZI|nr:hypothetical protein JX265_013655 [Neoarthrinium moseri]